MPTFSTPVAALMERLTYHTKANQTPARMLAAFNWKPDIITEVEGLADLPGIRIYVPDVGASYRPSRHEQSVIKFKLRIATKKSLGLTAHMQAIELVMDGLNYSPTTPAAIAFIPGTTKPFDWTSGDNFVVDTSINSDITITLEPKVVEIGKRRL